MRPIDPLRLTTALDRDQVALTVVPALVNGMHRLDTELCEPLAPTVRAAERPAFCSRLHKHPPRRVLGEQPRLETHSR